MYIFTAGEWKVVKIQPLKCIWTLFKNHPCYSYKRWSLVIGILSLQKIRYFRLYYSVRTIHMHEYLHGPTNILFRTLYILYILMSWAITKNNIDLGELLNAEAQIRANASPSGICGTQSFTGTGVFLYSGSLCLYDSTTAPHPHFIHLPSMLYSISN
jgi:hypothetical protein